MILILEQINSKVYKLKDEKNEVIYTCKKPIISFGNKYTIYDKNEYKLAELKQTPLSRNPYKLYINDSIIDEIKLHTKVPLEKYQLINKKWLIGGDITYTKYTVLDEQYNKVLEMSCNLANKNYSWKIELLESKDKLISILVIMAILSIAQK